MIITVSNQKGGTGKSTTAAAIVQGATFKGKKVLAIDLDPQCNLSFILGANPLDVGAHQLISGELSPIQTIQTTSLCSIVSGSYKLAESDTLLKGDKRLYAVKEAVKAFRDRFDLIVVDTPPTLGTLLINALTASDKVLIPMQADVLSMQGLFQLCDTIKNVQSKYNPDLQTAGIFFTRHNGRTVVAREAVEAITDKAQQWGIPVLKTFIRDGVAIKEAQMLRENLFEYAPKSKPAQDYLSLINEISI